MMVVYHFLFDRFGMFYYEIDLGLSARVLFPCILNIQFPWVTHNFYGERKKLNFLIYVKWKRFFSGFSRAFFPFISVRPNILILKRRGGETVCVCSIFCFYWNQLSILMKTGDCYL